MLEFSIEEHEGIEDELLWHIINLVNMIIINFTIFSLPHHVLVDYIHSGVNCKHILSFKNAFFL